MALFKSFKQNLVPQKFKIVDVIDVNNWASGSEIRAELYNTLSLDGYMLLKQGDIIDVTEDGKPVFENDISQRFFGMLGLSLKTKVATLTTLSVGAGAMYGIDLYTHESPISGFPIPKTLLGFPHLRILLIIFLSLIEPVSILTSLVSL